MIFHISPLETHSKPSSQYFTQHFYHGLHSAVLSGGRKAESCWREPGRVCLSPRQITPSSPSPFPVRFSTRWEAPTSVSWWTCTVSRTCQHSWASTVRLLSGGILFEEPRCVPPFCRITWPHTVGTLWFSFLSFHPCEHKLSSRPVHAE